MSGKTIFLILVVVLNAITVVYIRHQNRLAFITFQQAEQRSDQLDAEWGRLLLEKATWSVEHNIAIEAKKKLNMQAPTAKQMVTLNLNETVQ